MTTMVLFRVDDGDYAVPVEHSREIRSCEGLTHLPDSRSNVIGLLRNGNDTFPVLEAFGSRYEQVIVLQHDSRTFGLAVECVNEVAELSGEVGDAPSGQRGHLVSGVVESPAGLVLLLDIESLAAMLDDDSHADVGTDTELEPVGAQVGAGSQTGIT